MVVLSMLWPSKLEDTQLRPVAQETTAFGLQRVSFLPTLPGLYSGFLLWPLLVA